MVGLGGLVYRRVPARLIVPWPIDPVSPSAKGAILGASSTLLLQLALLVHPQASQESRGRHRAVKGATTDLVM